MLRSSIFAALCFVMMAAAPAFAGDAGLYPSAPPPGSAFIRFLNAGGNASAGIDVRGKAYGSGQPGITTSYVAVPHGETKITFGPASASPDLKEGAHYSAVMIKGVMTILEEPASDNPLKAEIILINASNTKSVSLKTPDGSIAIVDGVEPGQLGGRAVNAVEAPLAVYAGGKKVEDLAAHTLERGARYAVVVYTGADGKTAVSFN
jgi:hypothetical protein